MSNRAIYTIQWALVGVLCVCAFAMSGHSERSWMGWVIATCGVGIVTLGAWRQYRE